MLDATAVRAGSEFPLFVGTSSLRKKLRCGPVIEGNIVIAVTQEVEYEQSSDSAILERKQGEATVKTVYGEPIEAQGKTIIPVARIVFGFGAGTGTGGDKDSTARGEGGGRDGGARATLKRSPVWDRYLALLAENRLRTAELAR